MRRFLFRAVALVVVLGLGAVFTLAPGIVEKGKNTVVPHPPWAVSVAASAMHSRLEIADWHADSLLWDRDLTKRARRGHVDLPRLREGNVAVQVFTTVTKSPSGLNYEQNAADARDDITLLSIVQLRPFASWTDLTERALAQAAALNATAEDHPDELRVIRSRADLAAVLKARAEGGRVIGGVLGVEGGHALSGRIGNLDRLYDAGFRVIGLLHFFDNELGASLHGEAGVGGGLTDFGREVVAAMVAKSIIIDLAHASPKVAREVLEMVDVPVIVSHTGTYGHCATQRNFPDDLMRHIAAKGGLIGIGFWEEVTCDATPKGIAGAIVAAIALVGDDSVSLGSDFDGAISTTFDASELAALTQALIDAGLEEPVIAKVMGGNTLRFLAAGLPEG